MVVYVDSHCHIFEIKGYSSPADLIPVVVGYSHASNKKAYECAKAHGWPYVLGIAPQSSLKNDIKDLDSWVDYIRQARPNAIGEIGLDYKWAQTKTDLEKERIVFARMLDLAREMKLPVVIHSRNNPNNNPDKNDLPIDAVDDIMEMTKGMKMLMHFYSGTAEQAERIVARGGYISITALHSKERRRVIDVVPLERLLVETDAPYVGRTPENVKEVVEYIAEVKGLPIERVAKATADNARAFFRF